MKITILNDNIASGICDAAHGLSWILESDRKILFDAGPSEIAFQNASKIGIDVQQASLTVLSHGHWDHGNGLQYLNGGKLLAHPQIYRKRYKKSNQKSIGIDLTKSEIESKFDVCYSTSPEKISSNLWFLGEIPRKNKWDQGITDFITSDGTRDTVPDDTGLAAITSKGLIIISGCAHSGITNIVTKATKLFPDHPVFAIMGGFHLKPDDKRISEIIKFFKKFKVQQLYPSHCTAPEVICQLNNEFDVKFVKSGNVFKF